MAAAAIFGALSGLADFGEQRAEGSQIAADQIYQHLAREQKTQEFKTQQTEAQLRQQEARQRIQAGQQLIPYDKPIQAANGKVYQRFQDPRTGVLSYQELPGPAAETPEQAQVRGLKATGLFTDDQIQKMMEAQYTRTAGGQRVFYEPDPQGDPNMRLAVVKNADGTVAYQDRVQAPPSSLPSWSYSTGTNDWGDPTNRATFHGRGTPPPRFQAPQVAMGGLQAPPLPGTAQTTPGAGSGALGATPQSVLPPPDANGDIPPQPGLNERVRAEVNKVRREPAAYATVPPGGKADVDKWLSAYNKTWAPPIKLPPASITLIEKTQPVLQQIQRLKKDIEALGLMNNNQSAYLLKSRLLYTAGRASPEGTLGNDIAGLSLGSLVEAASALAGASRAMPALNKAMEHTPNAWVDSPKLIYQKLNEVERRLTDMVSVAKDPSTFTTTPTTTAAPAAGEAAPPPGATVRNF